MNYLAQFAEHYGNQGEIFTFFSPGRVNLIGEHIDYNGGTVLPAAISLGTTALVRVRDDQLVHVFSAQFPDVGVVTFSLDSITPQPGHPYINYVAGVFSFLIQSGYHIPHGVSMYLTSNLPIGAGLSSSASIEVLIATMCSDVFALKMEPLAIALLAQKVEREFVGMNCGIMDQAIIACGQDDMALSIQTDTLETQAIPVILPGRQWIIMNTNYTRKLTDSKYNERRQECEDALAAIRALGYSFPHLAAITPTQWRDIGYRITPYRLQQRANHVISEQHRVTLAIDALRRQDAAQLGLLLNASHRSLKDDYQVTGPHLDALVNAAWKHGAAGARMTGAGFGGCAIALVDERMVESFMKGVKDSYFKDTGLVVDFYPVKVVRGAHRIWRL